MAIDALPARWTAHVDHHVGGATLVRLAGEVTVRAAADVRRVLDDAVDANPRSLSIELGDVSLLDVAGLAALSSPAMRARRAAIAVAIYPPRAPTARRVIDQVGIVPMLRTPATAGESAADTVRTLR